ncbi:unnamed protein product, partial [Scytosiphon promiscuus]
ERVGNPLLLIAFTSAIRVFANPSRHLRFKSLRSWVNCPGNVARGAQGRSSPTDDYLPLSSRHFTAVQSCPHNARENPNPQPCSRSCDETDRNRRRRRGGLRRER